MDEATGGAVSAPEASVDTPAGSAAGAPPSPQPSPEPKASVRQLFDRYVLGRTPADNAAPAAGVADESGEDEPKEPEKKPDAAPAKREVTDEELTRLVQAETDRREAKRLAAQQAADAKRLRDEDPEAYVAREKEAEEAAGQFTSHAGLVISAYDEAVLTPVMAALPEKEREALIEAGINGLDGRGAAVTQALDVLKRSEYERGKADGAKDAEQKIRKNPAVLKQVLVGQREETDEPDEVPAGRVPAAKVDGNAALRSMYRSLRPN